MTQDPVAQWAETLAEARLPILRSTRELVVRLADDSRASMKDVGRALHQDPVMALAVVRMANARDQKRLRNELTTLDQAAMMLGLGRLAEHVKALPTIEDLIPRPVQAHLRRVMGRSYYASLLAGTWAQVRHDMIPTEVSLGALLYNIGEIALWTRIPAQMAELAVTKDRCRVPAHEAEYVVLGFALEPLSHRLAQAWSLPPMVLESMEARYAQEMRTLGVMLAAQLSRHAFSGWRDPYFVQDLDLAAEYLHVSLDDLTNSVNGITQQFNKLADHYDLPALTALSGELIAAARERMQKGSGRILCLAPRQDILRALQGRLAKGEGEAVRTALEALHHGLGLNRAVFARLGGERDAPVLVAESLIGTDYQPHFNRFRLPLGGNGLFEALMKKPSAVWINAQNRAKLWPLVPEEVKALISVDSFYAMSVFAQGKPVGLLYADRHSRACQLDARAFEDFKRVGALTAKALEPAAKGAR